MRYGRVTKRGVKPIVVRMRRVNRPIQLTGILKSVSQTKMVVRFRNAELDTEFTKDGEVWRDDLLGRAWEVVE